MPVDDVLSMFKAERVHYSSTWCKGMVALLKKVSGRPPACLATFVQGSSKVTDR